MHIQRDITIPELAQELGVSRVAVWNKVRSGRIPAHRVGTQYVIKAEDANVVLGRVLTDEQRVWIQNAVKRVVREYGVVLKKLSRE